MKSYRNDNPDDLVGFPVIAKNTDEICTYQLSELVTNPKQLGFMVKQLKKDKSRLWQIRKLGDYKYKLFTNYTYIDDVEALKTARSIYEQ